MATELETPPAPASQSSSTPPATPPETPPATPPPDDPATKLRAAGKSAFMDSLLAKRKPADTEDPPKDAAPGDAPPDPAKPDAAKPAEPAKKKIEVKPRPAPGMDPKEIANLAAETASQVVMRSREGKKAGEPKDDGRIDPGSMDLPDEVKAELDVYVELQTLDPKKYGGILKEFVEFNKAESVHIRKWEKEHPGQAFDKDAPEHDDFYDDAKPDVSEADLRKALRSVAKREAREEMAPEMAEIKREIRLGKVEPRARELSDSVTTRVMSEIHADFADAKKLAEDPIAKAVSDQVTPVANAYVGTLVRLFEGAEAFDNQNPLHNEISALAIDTEAKLAALSPEDKADEAGRTFATKAEFSMMSPAERKRHWVLAPEHVAFVIEGNLAEKAKAMYESEQKRLDAWAQKRGFAKPDAAKLAQSGSENGSGKAAEAPEPQRHVAPAPTVGSTPALPGKAAGKSQSSKSWKDSFGVGG